MRKAIVALAVFGIVLVTPPGAATRADSTITTDTRTKAERNHERADELRRRSAERAKRALREKPLPEEEVQSDHIDFRALSTQIRRLGEMLRQLGDAALESADSIAEGRQRRDVASIAPTVEEGQLAAIYGPEGPTERSVKAVLEHRLVVVGNPRLKAGAVVARPEGIVAEVVTAKEGALVERYIVDRKTGKWKPDR